MAHDVVAQLSRDEDALDQSLHVRPGSSAQCFGRGGHGMGCISTIHDKTMSLWVQMLEPSVLVAHLFRIAHASSRAIETLRVQGAPVPEACARLLLFRAARQTLARGLRLLGLTPLERV